MAIEFPVFVLSKDSQEVNRYESLAELQRHLEPIDVENHEYDAWDGSGRPVDLHVQERVWLDLRLAPQPGERSTLFDALRAFAASLGERVPTSIEHEDPAELYQRLKLAERRRRRRRV